MIDLFYRTEFRPKNNYWYILTKRYAMKVVEGSLEASVNVLLSEMKKKILLMLGIWKLKNHIWAFRPKKLYLPKS